MKQLICYFDAKATKVFVEKTNENGEKIIALSSKNNFVYKDEIVARIINIENPDELQKHIDKDYSYYTVETNFVIKSGEGIYYDQFSDCYKASEYGFVIIDPNRVLRLLSPLQLSKDKVFAYYLIFPTKFKKIPSYKDIEEIIHKNKILAIVDKNNIEEELDKIDKNAQKINKILVAKGKEVTNGYDEYFIPMINLEKKAGKVLEDGRIDFKEVDSIVEIKKGQEILKRIPAVKSVDGLSIYGEKISASFERKQGFIKGDYLVESANDKNVFISDINGCLNIEGKKVSISPVAIIKGNVDYDSGNIDFSGSVHVMGSVLPGFSVKAKGNIVIEKNADDAYIEAEGDILVKNGIGGKGSMKVVSGGKIKSKYIINSSIEAVKEIEVEDSIINSKVFSNDKIMLTAKHGTIIGGEAIARHEIIINVAGVENENITKLTVGVSLFIEREIVEIKKDYDYVKTELDEIMMKIKASFGESLFEDTKKFISILPPVKKKACLLLLAELTNKNKELKALNVRKAEAEAKLKLEREPVIIVTDTVFPGTIINIKKRRKNIVEKLINVKFFEHPEEKEITFTSAV